MSALSKKRIKIILMGTLTFLGLCGLFELALIAGAVLLWPSMDARTACIAAAVLAVTSLFLLNSQVRRYVSKFYGTGKLVSAYACSLPEKDLIARKQEVSSQLASLAISARSLKNGIEISFKNKTGLDELLNDFIGFESKCCAFLKMSKRSQGSQVLLEITGDNNAMEFLKEEVRDLIPNIVVE